MTTNEKFFQVILWGKLHNVLYSLGSLEINLCYIMVVTEACKFTLLPTRHSPGPAPAPSNSFKGTHPQAPDHVQMRHQDNEPLLSLQHIWSNFPKSLPVPESEPEFEYLHLNESFPTYLITFSCLSTETRMFQ